jgi:hypothetical protein
MNERGDAMRINRRAAMAVLLVVVVGGLGGKEGSSQKGDSPYYLCNVRINTIQPCPQGYE